MIRNKIEYKKKRNSMEFFSLRLKMLATMLFGAALATLLLLTINLGIRRYISVDYLSEESKAARDKAYKEDLQAYVTNNGLTVDDTGKIAQWAQENKYVYILIYKDDKLLFESGKYDDPEMEENKDNEAEKPSDSEENGENNENGGGSGENNSGTTDNPDGETNTPDEGGDGNATTDNPDKDNPDKDNPDKDDTDKDDTDKDNTDSDNKYPSTGITVKPPSRDELIANALKNGSYPIYTVDDGVLLASMVDYSEYLYYDVANIVSVVVALAAFIITMWIHFYGITKRITKLGKEVTVVAEGDMQHSIDAKGNDEISRLSMDVEYMRSSMLDNVQKEHKALEANKDLITAMSHDIRTPLTVLLGYLDIMKTNSPEGDMKNYIEASETTAMRLKKMSDDMFGYFLAYGSDIEVNIQECNARTLVEQMIPGYVFLLREQGYNIEYNFEGESAEFLDDVIVVTDPPQLMRIVENIFSNVMKYADKEKTISIKISSEVDEMTIKVSNYVSENPDGAQRNGIGLRSCMKLANAMDVRFSTEEVDGIFTSVMNVPVVADIKYSELENEKEKRGFKEWLNSVLQKSKKTSQKLWKGICKPFEKLKKNRKK